MRTTVTEFFINWKYLKAMNHLASRDQCRYVLNGVCVERRKNFAVLVATDGRKLGAYRASITDEKYVSSCNFIIPSFLIQKIDVPRDGDSRILVETVQENLGNQQYVTVFSGIDGLSMGCRTVGGNYPNWRQVLPGGNMQGRVVAQFNADFVSEIAKASKLLGGSGNIKLWQSEGALSPYYVDSGIKEFSAVLMPVRKDDTYLPPVPEILKEPTE